MTKIMNTGNTACAMAVKAANVDFIAAYPITPQTTISEKLADYAAAGELKGKYLPVESEHSVMSAVAAASATGARTFTATWWISGWRASLAAISDGSIRKPLSLIC